MAGPQKQTRTQQTHTREATEAAEAERRIQAGIDATDEKQPMEAKSEAPQTGARI
jgi:hypothetical protein